MKFENISRCKSCGDIKSSESMKSMKVGTALLRSMEQAEQDGRLVTGIVDIATELKRSSIKNTLCILKISDSDDMQGLLLEAYCREHNVKLIKVHQTTNTNCQITWNIDEHCKTDIHNRLQDCTSFLIQLPEHCSTEDDFILTFYKTHQLFVKSTFPTVNVCS